LITLITMHSIRFTIYNRLITSYSTSHSQFALAFADAFTVHRSPFAHARSIHRWHPPFYLFACLLACFFFGFFCFRCPDPSNNAKHRGFGFIEFESQSSAEEAAAAMHNFDLAGQYLRVCKAISTPDMVPWLIQKAPPSKAMQAAAAAAAALLAKQKQGQPGAAAAEEDEPPSPPKRGGQDDEDDEMAISGSTMRCV
jgi:hypothetical protein